LVNVDFSENLQVYSISIVTILRRRDGEITSHGTVNC
jgi:hypothetical protein